MIDTLLQTKLFIPPPPDQLVARPHLLTRLNDGLSGKLTLVAAPAGFGKTTLITSWIDSVGNAPRFCWLALDEDDNNVQQFFRYVAAALQPLSDAPLLLTQMSSAGQPVAAKSWAHALINDALALKRPFALILDDYHLIHAAEINDAINFILDHMPPHMHLVITCRADPNLNIARLRVQRQMTEIRAADLRMDTAEISFLAQQLDLPLTETQAALLNERTEGWIAGLQLAALAMQSPVGQRNLDDFISTFAGSHRFVMDYLTDEVLRGLPLNIESFLLQTSILTRFNSELCAALLTDERINATEMLHQLEQANLFLMPLDSQRRWYRYHHLFADLLRQRLSERFSADHITTLHRRAIEWLCAQDLIDEALSHAAAIDEWQVVADRMARLGNDQINQGNANRVTAWLARLPEPVIHTNPRLAVDMAWLRYMAFDIPGLLPWLEIAETLTDDEAHVGKTAVIRALYMMVMGDVADGVAFAETANAQLGEQHAAAKGGLLFMLANGYVMLGETAKSGEAIEAAIHYLERGGNLIGVSGATTLLIRHHLDAGHLQKAYSTSQQFMRRYATDVRLQNGGGMQAAVYHALVLHERHEAAQLADAEALVAQALALTRLTMPDSAIIIWMLLTLSLIKLARRETAVVHTLLQEADTHLAQIPPNSTLYGFYDFLIRCYLLTGQTAKAQHWLEAFDKLGASPEDPITFFNTVHQAEAALQATPDDATALLAASSQLIPIADIQPCGFVQLRALAVLALVEDALGESAAALATLAHLLETAAVEEWVAIFRFADGRMEKLLRQLRPQVQHPAFCDRVLTAISPTKRTPQSSQPLTKTADGLVLEPLSERELEVLQLVAEGHSNREVANKLYLAVGTVKRHLSNINGKLQAANRTQAVARARELNLL